VNTVPGPQNVHQDTALTLSTANGNRISIHDVDAGTNAVAVALTATNGTLTLSGTTGLTFTSGDGTADASMAFTGTLVNINAALDGLEFSPTAGYSGSASVQIVTDDQGNTGSGGPQSDSDTVSITVNAVSPTLNDAPVNTVPGPQNVHQDTALTLSTANGNRISIHDVDAGTNAVAVALTATNGTLTLSGTSGLNFTAGDGTANASMAFTGTLVNINAALDGLKFSPTGGYSGSASVQIVTDDQGNTGSGGAASDSDTVSISVNAVSPTLNDAPVNTVPGPQNVHQDTALTLSTANGNRISIHDVDAGTNAVAVTLTASNGTLTLSGTTGLTFSSGDGMADASMAFTGTLVNINAALDGLKFSPTAGYSGSATVQIVTDDQGNTGSGGPQSDSDTVSITVNAVSPTLNDAPVNTVPGPQNVHQDTAFTAANSNLIAISDLDAGNQAVAVALTATNGTLTLSGTSGLNFTAGDGTANASMALTGTIANINTALDGMSFNPTAGYSGSASVQIVTDDQGNTGSGGPQSDSDTVSITVNAVSPTLNDAPVNTVPGPQNVHQDTALTLSTANSNRISIHDVDAGSNAVAVTLTATNGTLTLSGTTGLTFTTGDGTADGSMAFTGTLVNINAALDGLKFSPTGGYSGSASVQIVTDDQGNTGSGGAASDSDTVSITVNAVSPTLNDAPVNTVPGPQNVPQDTALTLSTANGNRISISDVDAGTNAVAVALTATNGTLTLSGTSGLSFTTGDGTADASMAFTGMLVNINTALDGLEFSPTGGYSGSASVQIVTDDQGNTGSGGAASNSDTVSISVNAVSPTLNDAPVNTVPGPQNVHQDTALTFSTANSNLIAISDLDADNQAVAVTLTATNGTLTLSSGSAAALTFSSGDGTANASMAFTGTLVNINAALDGLKFSPTAGYSGSATVQIVTDDQGNTGSGGPQSDSDTVSITVNAVSPTLNDAPVNTVPGPQNVPQDTALTLSTANGNRISIHDVDAGTNAVAVTLTASNGTLTLSSGSAAALTFSSGDGTADASMAFTGTLVNINAALDGLEFSPTVGYND